MTTATIAENEVVPGLSIGKDGIHHLKVPQVSDQQTAARSIEHGSDDEGEREDTEQSMARGTRSQIEAPPLAGMQGSARLHE